MAARAARLEQADALGELDEEGRGRLAALRMRCSRATERARLADEIADRFADVRATRRRAAFTGSSTGDPRRP